MDRAGFAKACVTSAAAFETAVMYLFEDPWERLRLLRHLMPKTPLNFLIRSRNLMGWRFFPNDVVALFFKCIQRTGIQWVKIFDGLNDLQIIEWHFQVAKKIGLRSSGILVFSESPVHTDEYYAAKAKELVKFGVDAVLLADASGVLKPERAQTLIPAMHQILNGKVRFEFTAHSCTGLADDVYLEAMRSGVDLLNTASLPLAHGESVPATIEVMQHARRMGRELRVDEQRIKEIDDYFFWVAYQEKKPIGKPVLYDLTEYSKYAAHQIPGGMMSNLVNQLSELALLHKLPEILKEGARVRREIGYPVMVTPFSQLVGVQATLNVIEGERYRTVPQELRLYARGCYGKPAAPFDPNALDRILAEGSMEPIDPQESFDEPLVDKVRAEQGSFKSDEDLLLSIFNARKTMEKFYQNKKTIEMRPLVRKPLVALIKELANRRDIRLIRIEKGPLKLTQIG